MLMPKIIILHISNLDDKFIIMIKHPERIIADQLLVG